MTAEYVEIPDGAGLFEFAVAHAADEDRRRALEERGPLPRIVGGARPAAGLHYLHGYRIMWWESLAERDLAEIVSYRYGGPVRTALHLADGTSVTRDVEGKCVGREWHPSPSSGFGAFDRDAKVLSWELIGRDLSGEAASLLEWRKETGAYEIPAGLIVSVSWAPVKYALRGGSEWEEAERLRAAGEDLSERPPGYERLAVRRAA